MKVFAERIRSPVRTHGILLLLFGLFWSALTLLFDGFVVVPAARQLIATTYPSTDGTILSSEVTHHSGRKGGTHGVAVQYKYSVGGREFVGDRHSYDQAMSSDSGWAHKLVAAWPPGASVRVFYNPKNPQDAVLQTGLDGGELFWFAFLTPFNAIMMGLWWDGWARLRRKWFRPLAGGVRITAKPGETRARLTTFSPIAVGLAAMALLAFLSIFAVGFAAGGFYPTTRTMAITWSIILCGGVAAGAWQWRQVLSGKYDLIIDNLGGALVLPLTGGRKERLRVPLASIESISVERFQRPLQGSEQASYTYIPVIRYREDTLQSAGLVEWYGAEKAEEFVLWLRQRL